jgi:hypothetical protein
MTSEKIEITQADFSSFIFATPSTNPENVHLTINPLINISTSASSENGETQIKEFEIKNLRFTKKPKLGELKRIAPKHRSTNESCTGFYFGGCEEKLSPKEVKDDGANFEYEITNSSEIKQAYYDQVSGISNASPNFRIIFHNIGSFDSDKIMKRDGRVDGRKYAQYAEINPSDLDGAFEFDVFVKFKDGEKFMTHIVVNFTGEQIISGKTIQGEIQ